MIWEGFLAPRIPQGSRWLTGGGPGAGAGGAGAALVNVTKTAIEAERTRLLSDDVSISIFSYACYCFFVGDAVLMLFGKSEMWMEGRRCRERAYVCVRNVCL